MAAKTYYSPFIPAFSPNGLPVAGAFLYFFYSGGNVPAPIYADVNLSVPLANPVQADLAARFAPIYLDDTITYRVRLTDSQGTPLGSDIDPYTPGVAGFGPQGNDGEDGADGINGTNGAVGSSSGLSALFTAASGMAVGAGITKVQTSGYDTAGIGGADYIYDAAVTSGTVAANPRTQFLAADGRGFRLDPEQDITFEMFGCHGTYVNSGNRGTDNYAPATAALAFRASAAFGFGPPIRFGVGRFWFSQTLNSSLAVNMEGMLTGLHGHAGVTGFYPTQLVFPTDTVCIRLKSSPSNGFSRVANLLISQETMGTNLSAHAVYASTAVVLERLTFTNIAGDGQRIVATGGSGGETEGEASNWVSIDCYAHLVGGNGSYVAGQDTNIGRCIGFRTQQCGLAGIYEDGAFVNHYEQVHLAGYANGPGATRGVQYGGRAWQPIEPNTNQVPGASNVYWYDNGPLASPSASFPAWNSATAYVAKGPIIARRGGVFVSCYIEGGGEYGFAHGPTSTIIGPDMGWTHFTKCSDALRYYRYASVNNPAYSTIGESETLEFAYRRDGRPVTARSALMYLDVGGDRTLWDWEQSSAYLAFRTPGATGEHFGLTFSKPTNHRGNRKAGYQHKMLLPGFGLTDRSGGSYDTRLVEIADSVPTYGEWQQGDRVFAKNPSVGNPEYWVCTVSGAIAQGPWVDDEYCLIGDVRSSDGKAWVVSNRGLGYGTTAPTGTVTFNDPVTGMVWEPVTTAFVFVAKNL